MHTTDIDTAREINDDAHINGHSDLPAFPDRCDALGDDWVSDRLRDLRVLREAFGADNLSMDTPTDWDAFLLEVGELAIDCRFVLPSEEEAHFAELGRTFYNLAMGHVNKSVEGE